MSPLVGKRVAYRTYLHVDQLGLLDPAVAQTVDRAADIGRGRGCTDFNVIRIDDRSDEVALLHYPTLGEEPFPALAASWRVHLPTALVTYRRYTDSLNPPILHRTELLLAPDHPARPAFESLSRTCEQIGLFDNATIIGFQRQWSELVRSKGYQLDGAELIPLGNVEDDSDVTNASPPLFDFGSVSRHLTALSRTSLSAPVQSLVRDGLLRHDTEFFDYGCGKGDDLAALLTSGYRGGGWDPHYRPEAERYSADVVNLGFVINVIEDASERIEALQGAYGLTNQVLAIAAMVATSSPSYGRAYRDGVLTSRNTFQKYYTQGELQQFIESVLDEDAYPAAPGVFYVFKDREVEQRYLLAKSSDRSRVSRARLATIKRVRPPRPERIKRPPKTESPEALACLDRLWRLALELGRTPDIDEISDSESVRSLFGSHKRALRACLARNDSAQLDRAAEGRRDDILVMLALRFFERRRQFTRLEPRLQRDIKTHFGSFAMAEAIAQELLFSVKDSELINTACEDASAAGLGWLEHGQFLQLHTSMVERLPASLRVYIGCATALAGDINAFDLVKVHIQSGKVTLMSFADFVGKPLPALQQRIKVRLRDQDLDIFEYGEKYPPTLLYRKSRYINEEFPCYAEQVAFEEELESLGLIDLDGYGHPEAEFLEILRSARRRIVGFQLVPADEIPNLDDKCGTTFTYRDFIECGETWRRVRPDNMPLSPDTYNALYELARHILDPVVDYFGAIQLTYGFASKALTKHIAGRIDPTVDQHAACETKPDGRRVCPRTGAAVDFLVEYENMRDVARWIIEHTPFDRLYFFGEDKPLHVSFGPAHSRLIYEMYENGGRRIPRRVSVL